MASWFTTSAEELRKQISYAVTPRESPAGQAEGLPAGLFGTGLVHAEHGEASAATSAQRLATQADEGLQSLRTGLLSTFAEAVGAATPSPARRASAASVEELTQKFNVEAELLTNALVAADATDASIAAAVKATLKTWEDRLAEDSEETGRRLAAPALRALLRSGAPRAMLQALAASTGRRRAFVQAAEQAAVLAAAEAEAGGEESVSPRRLSETCEADHDDSPGKVLARLLSVTSSGAPPLLAQLLGLLARAMGAADACRSGTLASDSVAAEEEVRWLLNIILSAITDSREADVLAASRLCEAVEQVLAAAASLSREKAEKAQAAADAAAAVSPTARWSNSAAAEKLAGAAPKLEVGSEVWACWPGDGSWYRAKVKVPSNKRERVQVTWSSPPSAGKKKKGSPDEYLAVDEKKQRPRFSELSASSVLLVDATIRRPPPTPEDGLPGEDWESRLSAVEAHCMHCNELRSLGAQLECEKRPEPRDAPEAGPEGGRPGEDGAPPLQGAAGTLQALRGEAEERAEKLGHVVLECGEEAKRFEEQIDTSSRTMAAELQALRDERTNVVSKVEGLRSRREELLEELRRASGELSEAEAMKDALDQREHSLQDCQVRVEDELSQQLHSAQEHGRVAAERQSVLQGSAEASLSVEKQLAERSVAVLDAASTQDKLGSQQQAVGETCVASDRARYAELQELIVGWQEWVWGPLSSLLPRHRAVAAALRAGHEQALGAVETALQEAEAMTSASGGAILLEGIFGFNSTSNEDDKGSEARQISCYRDMEQQLKENLDRLTELETVASFVNMTN